MAGQLRFTVEQVVWQEVPGEVSLAFTISGCPLRCKGCHSSAARNPSAGVPLTLEYLEARLNQYRGLISCVLFLGGEWQPEPLKKLLSLARAHNLKTCLYTGYEQVAPELMPHLTFLKTGPWIAELGGLDSAITNQRFIDLSTQENLNYKFHKPHRHQGVTHVAP
ncbi:anaerobic ribonucleoside-triphosphate reductase activating protein [Cellvibrio sp.]|uniref:anaerobic ribonucleoside-triphosphate reductase activating protein n=1 Tax=Cellvibrio sp. TaxID=1965322 RepID=UPI00396479F0